MDGKDVEVSPEVYSAYATGGRKMKYMELDLKRDRILQDTDGKAVKDANGYSIMLPEREMSLDQLLEESGDYSSSDPSPEAVVFTRFEINGLHKCLDLLNAGERALINALFFSGLTEREYAQNLGISKTALHVRKVKILTKLKNLIDQ